MTALRIATRQSPLALAQARWVADRLIAHGHECELVALNTRGDENTTDPLSTMAGVGVFAVEVQRAVLDGRADVAVHSAKDLPSVTPEGLRIVAVPERRDVADVLVGRSLAGLGPGATVATGSPRRRALLAQRRPDLNFVELRGNMATRLAAVGGHIDAVVAAAAALERLGWSDRVAERLDPSWMTPQVGQAALAVECASESPWAEVVASIDDPLAHRTLEAEREFLRELGSGCSVPAGAYCRWDGDELVIDGVMAATDGSRVLRATRRHRDISVGADLARELRDELGGADLPGWRA